MKFKGLTAWVVSFFVVLFSYTIANAQDKTTTPPASPRVVVTDPLEKPATTTAQTATPATKTTTFGNHAVTVTENVTGMNLENGKFLTVTRWNGTKWVTKREWVLNKTAPAATKPNP